MKNEFTNKLQATIAKAFPKSKVDVSIDERMFGLGKSCTVRFTLGSDSSEYVSGYAENDDFKTTISIMGFNADGNPLEKLEVESANTSFHIKPEAGSYLAFGRVKTGWRNFKATPEKTIERIGKHFAGMRALLVENYGRLTEESKKLVDEKGYNSSI